MWQTTEKHGLPGGKPRGYAQKQLPENCRRENAIIFVLIELIIRGNDKTLDHSRSFLYILNIEKHNSRFLNTYMGNLGL